MKKIFKDFHKRILYYSMEIYFTRILRSVKPVNKPTPAHNFLRVEKRKKIVWPKKKKVVFVLHFDDFCPRTINEGGYDFGGDPLKGINILFLRLMNKYKFLKSTLFVIPQPTFKNEGRFSDSYKKNRMSITNKRHSKWVNWIISKKFLERNEIAVHGLNHHQLDKRFVFPWMEYEFKDYEKSLVSLRESLSLFEKIGLNPKGFKPPSWGVGHNSGFGLLKALKKTTLSYACLSTPSAGLNLWEKRVSNIYPERFMDVLNIPENLSIDEPVNNLIKKCEDIISYNGIISIKGHYTGGNRFTNGISKNTLKNLSELIEYLVKKYPKKIWFAKMAEIAKWWENEQKQ